MFIERRIKVSYLCSFVEFNNKKEGGESIILTFSSCLVRLGLLLHLFQSHILRPLFSSSCRLVSGRLETHFCCVLRALSDDDGPISTLELTEKIRGTCVVFERNPGGGLPLVKRIK